MGKNDIPTEAAEWIVGRDTGTSSKTIWAALTGSVHGPRRLDWTFDIPHDGDDFGRCYRLVVQVPGWAMRISEIVDVFPAWEPIVREWNKLASLYREKAWVQLYETMRPLCAESRILDGWRRTGPSSWERRVKP